MNLPSLKIPLLGTIVIALLIVVVFLPPIASNNSTLEIEEGRAGYFVSPSRVIGVIFDHVVEDTRCPTDVVCIIPGWVTINVFVSSSSYDAEFNMTLPGNADRGDTRDLEGLSLKLVLQKVDPLPSTSEPEPSYSATFALEEV